MTQKVIRTPTQIHTRKLDRLVAHRNMKRAGIRRANTHDYYGPLYDRTRTKSYFAEHWREYVTVPTVDLRRKSK